MIARTRKPKLEFVPDEKTLQASVDVEPTGLQNSAVGHVRPVDSTCAACDGGLPLPHPLALLAKEPTPRQRYRALQEIRFVTREGNLSTIGQGQKFSTDGWIAFDPARMERI